MGRSSSSLRDIARRLVAALYPTEVAARLGAEIEAAAAELDAHAAACAEERTRLIAEARAAEELVAELRARTEARAKLVRIAALRTEIEMGRK